MPHRTADDLLSLSVTGLANNLSALSSTPTDNEKWEVERCILFVHHLLEMVEGDYNMWQGRIQAKIQQPNKAAAERYASLFKRIADMVSSLQDQAEKLGRALQSGHVAHCEPLFLDGIKVDRLLKEAEASPVLRATVPAQIAFDVTEEEAAAIERVMAAPPGSPGKIGFETQRVPLAPAALLR